ncbi:hypothetical protein PIB30_072098 [Stylosanthes scabra]|uniref:Uncharacterized protein n=1 Tax=Stylosanthes scabra TaxID=79078 RepID=A0ABU6XMD0_9FABA|nr:hypothetical protein [Stylosanthes scabra]
MVPYPWWIFEFSWYRWCSSLPLSSHNIISGWCMRMRQGLDEPDGAWRSSMRIWV